MVAIARLTLKRGKRNSLGGTLVHVHIQLHAQWLCSMVVKDHGSGNATWANIVGGCHSLRGEGQIFDSSRRWRAVLNRRPKSLAHMREG